MKKTNQDSVLVKSRKTNHDKVCLCVVCDGMGGLADGELASGDSDPGVRSVVYQ